MSLALASRYANALLDVVLASKERIEPQAVISQLRSLEALVASSPDFRNVLQSPAVPLKKKNAVMGRLCDMLAMDRLVRNFVFIVVRKRRGSLFPLIRGAIERLLDERTGIMKAEVSSAVDLSPGSKAAVEAQLARIAGKSVRCQYSVDAGLLGGVLARMGSTLYDGSVRGQLDALRRKLAGGI